MRCNEGRSHIDDVRDESLAAALSSGLAVNDRSERGPRRRPTRSSCACRRRSRVQGPGPGPGARRGRGFVASAPEGPARRPPVDDLPRHDPRPVPRAASKRLRPRGRPGLRPGVRAGARQPRRSARPARGVPRLVGGVDAGGHRARRRAPPRIATTVHELSRPTPPSWPSCSRTCSATSTSRSSTSSRCCASGWAWTSGRSSTQRPPSRSGSCPSARARRRWPLHPGRPVLPLLARASVRLHRPIHRARRRHQPGDATPRGGARR